MRFPWEKQSCGDLRFGMSAILVVFSRMSNENIRGGNLEVLHKWEYVILLGMTQLIEVF